MKRFDEKVLQFLTALLDVYRDEDARELDAFSKLELEDLTEDFTAMLVALSVFCQRASGFGGDLIEFTHVLNKLAVQHIMEGPGGDSDE